MAFAYRGPMSLSGGITSTLQFAQSINLSLYEILLDEILSHAAPRSVQLNFFLAEICSYEILSDIFTPVQLQGMAALLNFSLLKFYPPPSPTPPPREGLSGPLFSPLSKKVGEGWSAARLTPQWEV